MKYIIIIITLYCWTDSNLFMTFARRQSATKATKALERKFEIGWSKVPLPLYETLLIQNVHVYLYVWYV